jgi:Co/Zn/Cd efflux system component
MADPCSSGGGCCDGKEDAIKALYQRQRSVLWTVLVINLVMFGVEVAAGWQAASLSLTSDGLDMLGDALVYGTSLYVLTRGTRAQAHAALFKGGIMAATAIAVFARATYQLATQATPAVTVMGTVGILALAANLVCLALLSRHRQDNLNMSAVWLCSRNDILANTSVLGATGLVALTGSFWPDFFVGLVLAGVFAKSASHVLGRSLRSLGESAV